MSGDATASGHHDFAQGVLEIVGPDMAQSLEFYARLGFTLVRHSGSFAVIQWQGQRLFLAEDPRATTEPRWANIRLMTDDVDAVHDALRTAGVEILHGLGDRPYGLRDFVVRDPNGFDVRFAQALTRTCRHD